MIHREGYATLGLVAGLGLVVNAAAWALLPGALVFTLPLALLAWGFFAQFFRSPARHTPRLPHTAIAPADGTIVAVERVVEDEYFHDERLKISIYMSALNVHLNRVPFDGVVRYARYHPGRYLVAFHPKASTLNERNTLVIADARGHEVLVRQIAGLLARRIVSYLRVGQAVAAGQELGFIKFGSRCDIFLPTDAQVLVQLQQRVKGGETPLARF
jgi:phosphatidylserine decarboxylase